MIKKIVLGFVLIIIIAMAGLTYYVSSMDWNIYKNNIANKVSELTGKAIVINGKISVSLFPQPKMSADNIAVYNSSDTQHPLAKIQKLDTSVDMFSLLRGRPDIKSLTLDKAEIWINQDSSGAFNWQNSKDERISETVLSSNLQNMTLHDTTVHYNNAGLDFGFDLNNVTADIQAASITGPYRLYGNFIKDNDHFGIALDLGSVSSLESIDVGFAITHPTTDSKLVFEGIFNPDKHDIKGELSGESQKTADFVNVLYGRKILGERDNVNLQFSVGLEATEEKLDLSRFALNYGGMIEGSGLVNIPLNVPDGEKPTITLKYELINFDVRPLLSILKAEYETFKKNGSYYNPNSRYNIDFDIAAQRVTLSDRDLGYIENITAKGKFNDNILLLDEFYAAAAGNTAISMNGSLLEKDTRPQYFIKTTILSENLLTFLNSLGFKLESYTQSTYRNAEINLELTGNDISVDVDTARLSMDKMNMAAKSKISFATETPKINLAFSADNIILDNYLPKDQNEGDFFAQIQKDLQQAKLFTGYDLTAKADIAKVIFRSTEINGLGFDIALQNNNITVNNLQFNDIYGTKASFSAKLEKADTDEPIFTDLQYKISSNNIYEMILQTNLHLPSWKLFNAKSFKADGNINGTLAQLTADSKFQFDDVKLSYKGKISDLSNKAIFDGDINITTTNYGDFSKNIGINIPAINSNRGALNFSAKLDGSTDDYKFSNVHSRLGVDVYQGSFAYKKEDNIQKIKAVINADIFNLEYLFNTKIAKTSLPSSLYDNTFLARPSFNRDELQLQAYQDMDLDIEVMATEATYKGHTFEQMHFIVSNSNNIMKVFDLSFSDNDTKVSGNFDIKYMQLDEPEINGKLNFANIKIEKLGGEVYQVEKADMDASIEFSGKANSLENLINNANAAANVTFKGLTVKGFDFAAIKDDLAQRKYSKGLFQAIRDRLQSGTSEFNEIPAQIKINNGNLEFTDVLAKNNDVYLKISGNASLKDWKMETIFNCIPKGSEDLAFSFNLNGAINKPTLDIDIENLVKHYDEYWEQIRQEEEKQKALEQQELEVSMKDAQEKTRQLETALISAKRLLQEHKKDVYDKQELLWYNEKIDYLDSISDEIADMKSKAKTPDFTKDDTNRIIEKCTNYQPELNQLNDEIKRHYKINADLLYHKILNDANEANSNFENKVSAFRTKREEMAKKFTDIREMQKIVTPVELNQLEGKINNLSQQYKDIEQALNNVNIVNQLEGKYSLLHKVSTNLDTFKHDTEDMDFTANQFVKKWQIRIDEINRQKAAAIQNDNPFNENTNPAVAAIEALSNTNSANNTNKQKKPLLKQLDDIDNLKYEDLNTDDEQNDNSDLSKAQGSIYSSDKLENNTTVQKSGLLKEVDGAVVKASGTIKVK